MLLQTNLISSLANEGKKITVIAPDKADPNLQDLALHDHIQIEEWTERHSIWDDDYFHRRMYFLEDIDQNVALKEKVINGLLYSDSKHPWKRIRPLLYYLIYRLIKYFPSIRSQFLRRESQNLESVTAERLMEKIAPRLIISTYPVSALDAKCLYAGKKLGVPTLIHLLSWDNISCKGRFPVVADQFIVWGEVMKKEVIDYYSLNPNCIYAAGVPHFDHHVWVSKNPDYAKIIISSGLDPNKPYIFFGMSSPRFAPKEIEIVEWLSKKIEDDFFGPHIQLVVRPHPQNMKTYLADESWLDRLQQIQSPRTAIDYPNLNESKIRWSMKPDDMNHLSHLLAGCSICINSGSTLSIDALFYDKPVIISAFDGHERLAYWRSARRLIDYPHLKKFIASGGVSVVRSFDELGASIQTDLDRPKINQERRLLALKKYCSNIDGGSTLEVIEIVKRILENTSSSVPPTQAAGTT
jgi:hypothetical protein